MSICKLIYYASSSKDKEVPSVTNQLADKLTTNSLKPDNEQPTSSFIINDDYKDENAPIGHAAVDTKSVRKMNNIVFII